MQNKNIPHIQKHSSTILSRTVFPAHVLALSVMVGWSAQPSSEFPASSPSSELLSLESDGGAGMFSCLARLCSIMHTRIVLHAFGGWMRKPCRRHLHLCLMTPMHRSTVVRVELCAKLYCLCFGVVTRGRGVISHMRSIYPLSPRMMPWWGSWGPSNASNKGDCLRILASCTDPGHFAITLVRIKSASHIT